jgi:hypothetical protein
MALNMTTFEAALKQHYTDWKVENLVYKNNPFYAMVTKYEKFGGELMKVPLIYGNPQGRSAAIATAVANKTSSNLKAFLLTRVQNYGTASISNEVILASEGDSNAFLRAATVEIDGTLQSVARDLAIDLYRDGTGVRGQIISTQVSSAYPITLANADDITNFEVGMAMVFAATKTGAPSATPYYIVAIDRDLGTFEVSATVGGAHVTATTAGAAASYYIFVQGDSNAKISGLDAWMPATVTSAAYFNVDRTADRTRLAGIYMDNSAMSIEEALITLAARIGREGGTPDTVFLNHSDYSNLDKSLGSKVQYVMEKTGYEGQISFRALQLNTPTGVVKVFADQNCPSGVAYMLQMNTWKLASLGKAPRMFDTDGLRMLREASSDSVEIRVFSYAQLACNAPGWNGVAKLK